MEYNRQRMARQRARAAVARREITGHPIRAQRIVVFGDVQLPWEDPCALDLVLQFIAWWKPDTVVLNGDITDCYAMSHFDKNPLNIGATEQEITKGKRLLGLLKSVPQKIWLGGNHEDRWRKILWREAGSKGGLSPVVIALMHGLGIDRFDVDESWRRIFGVKEAGFTYWPYRHYLELAEANLLITHGFLVSMHSGYSAKRHYERLGKSVLVNHTHRMGSFLITQLWEPKGAWENGCLCRLDPEYVQFPNWQQAFSTITVSGNSFHVTQIPILPGYRIQYQEHVLTANPLRHWQEDPP